MMVTTVWLSAMADLVFHSRSKLLEVEGFIIFIFTVMNPPHSSLPPPLPPPPPPHQHPTKKTSHFCMCVYIYICSNFCCYSCYWVSAEHKFDYNQTWTDNDMQTDRMSVQSRLFSMCLQVNVLLKKRARQYSVYVFFVFLWVLNFTLVCLSVLMPRFPCVVLETASKDFLHPLSIGMKFLKMYTYGSFSVNLLLSLFRKNWCLKVVIMRLGALPFCVGLSAVPVTSWTWLVCVALHWEPNVSSSSLVRSKHIKGSKEHSLLAQNTTCTFSGPSLYQV